MNRKIIFTSLVRAFDAARVVGVVLLASGIWRLVAPASFDLRCVIASLVRGPVDGTLAAAVVPDAIAGLEILAGIGFVTRRGVRAWLLFVLAQLALVATFASATASPGVAEAGVGLFPVFHVVADLIVAVGVACAGMVLVWWLTLTRLESPQPSEA